MSRLERVTLVPDDSDDEGRDSSSRARDNYYTSQRMSRDAARPSTSTSHQTSRSRGKRPAQQGTDYQEPKDFANLDEASAPPPVQQDDDPYYTRQPKLEENVKYSQAETEGFQRRKGHERQESARRRRNIPQGEDDLTEVAAPPPVPKVEEYDSSKLEKQHEDGGDITDDDEPTGDNDDAQSSAAISPHRQRKPDELIDDEPEVSKWLTELFTISYLIFFALMGTLARLGTQWITFYPGTPIVTPVLWANFGGSFIMGFLAEDQALFSSPSQRIVNEEKARQGPETEHGLHEITKAEAMKRKKVIPLYVGLATGFCGSYTSFSSFARDVFLALSNNLATPINHPHPGLIQLPSSTVSRNGGYSFEAFIQVIIFTIALSIGALLAGAQVAAFASDITPRIHGSFVRKFLDPAMVVLGFGCWLGAVLMAIFPPDRPGGPVGVSSWIHEKWRGEVLFALVFAPLGCLLRFYTSLKLNGLVPAFPLGTFAVNMFGTAVEGMCYDLQHVGVGIMGGIGGGVIGCQVLQGVMDGFCGTLTTVSTWVAEINGLKRKHGWAYAFASVFGAFCLMVVIMGSVRWGHGYIDPICDTGYTSKVHG